MFRKILCAVDFSPEAQYALQVAAQLAKAPDAQLVIAHVGVLPAFASTRYPYPPEPDLVDAVLAEQERALASALNDAVRFGATRATKIMLHGDPWSRLVELLDTDRTFDLAVLGYEGRSAIAYALLGSVAERVVRHAPCSVLVARPRGEVRPFKHALCAFDLSDDAQPVLARAADAVARDGTIALVHVIEPAGELTLDLEATSQRVARELESRAAELRTRTGVRVTAVVDTGSPGTRVLATLDDDPSYDLAVVGTHGRTGLRRVLLGSVAEKVVRHAPCSVLVARA